MKINYRQLSIMVFMSFIALKFLALPSLLYKSAGNMGWFVNLILMLIDTIYAFIIIGLMKKCNEKNIYEFLKHTVGVVLAKLFIFCLMLKFLLVILNLVKGLEFFVAENLYNKLDWVLFFLPLVAVVSFLIYKGIRNIGRVYEMFFVAIIIGCIYIGLKAVTSVDILSFLPMFKDGFVPILKTGYTHLSWYGSSTFLFMLFGSVDFNKGKKSCLIKYIVYALLLVNFLYFVFYGLFDITAPIHNFCLSDISQFYSGIQSTDEIAWLVVSLWIVAQTVQIAMYCYCLMLTIRYLFNIKSKIPPIIIIGVYIYLIGYISEKTINLESVLFTDFVSLLTIFTSYILPIILWISYIIKNKFKKKSGNLEQQLATGGAKWKN